MVEIMCFSAIFQEYQDGCDRGFGNMYSLIHMFFIFDVFKVSLAVMTMQ